MKKLTTLILTILPLIIWAHQDKYYTYEFDNVTVRFKTGWLYEELNNSKIIGKYAALLSESMGCNKPILLDFIHDYGHSYHGKTLSFLNIGSEEYELVSYSKPEYDSTRNDTLYYPVALTDTTDYDLKGFRKENYKVTTENSSDKIVIRQFGYYFEIDRTLKLLHSAISQPEKIKAITTQDTLIGSANMYYCLESISTSAIDSIIKIHSLEIERILEQKIYRENDLVENQPKNYSYFAQNNKYFVSSQLHYEEVILDTLDYIYSFKASINNDNYLFVFETPNKFRHYKQHWLNQEFIRSKEHNLPIDKFEYISSINVEWLGDDIFIITYQKSPVRAFSRFVYLEEEDFVIKDFDSYLDSHRKN